MTQIVTPGQARAEALGIGPENEASTKDLIGALYRQNAAIRIGASMDTMAATVAVVSAVLIGHMKPDLSLFGPPLEKTPDMGEHKQAWVDQQNADAEKFVRRFERTLGGAVSLARSIAILASRAVSEGGEQAAEDSPALQGAPGDEDAA